MLKKLTRFVKACSIKQTNKQTNKQTYYYGRRFKLFTRIFLFRMWGEWYYLVSSSRDFYA